MTKPSETQVKEMEALHAEIGNLALRDDSVGMTDEQIQLLTDVK